MSNGSTVPTKARYDKARQEAIEILKNVGISGPPVSPLDVASHLGLTVSVIEMPPDHRDVAGFLDVKNKQIFVNQEDPPNRQTFTVAHEIGHYLLHREVIEAHPDQYELLFRGKMLEAHTPMEQEANCFAANLLVPEEMLRQYEGLPSSVLPYLFKVSPEVISNRRKSIWAEQKPH